MNRVKANPDLSTIMLTAVMQQSRLICSIHHVRLPRKYFLERKICYGHWNQKVFLCSCWEPQWKDDFLTNESVVSIRRKIEMLNCTNNFIVSLRSLPNVIKRTFGLGNKNLSFLTFLFPNMICLQCSVANMINIFTVFAAENTSLAAWRNSVWQR